MSESDQIPLLLDLIKRGDSIEPHLQESLDSANHLDIEINGEMEPEQDGDNSNIQDDAFPEYSNVRELILEEEIRLILDKHMEQAYEEISRLLQKREL